jgi:hypothetical protein
MRRTDPLELIVLRITVIETPSAEIVYQMSLYTSSFPMHGDFPDSITDVTHLS